MARIIIAEDDEIVAEIARDALIGAGHAAGVLENGRDALLTIRRRKPDLVILDCNMPELGGMTVLRELRKTDEFHDLPVLILTGRQGEKDVEQAYYDGADDYMKKPFEPDELVFRVEELLKQKEARAAKR